MITFKGGGARNACYLINLYDKLYIFWYFTYHPRAFPSNLLHLPTRQLGSSPSYICLSTKFHARMREREREREDGNGSGRSGIIKTNCPASFEEETTKSH